MKRKTFKYFAVRPLIMTLLMSVLHKSHSKRCLSHVPHKLQEIAEIFKCNRQFFTFNATRRVKQQRIGCHSINNT